MTRGSVVINPRTYKLALGDSFYASVDGLDTETSETVVPSGETWVVRVFVGAGARLDDTVAALYWDYGGAGETLLAATHGDATITLAEEVTGDGTKVLALVLVNDTQSSRIMGGQWEAERT